MLDKSVLIGSWFYGDSKEEESYYPGVAGLGTSSAEAFQAVYWKCVVVFYATSVRNNPGARHVFFTNMARIPHIGTFDVGEFLHRLGVEVVRLPLTFVAPPGFYGAWRNQFYVFDIVRHLARTCAEDDVCIVLDSDCAWVQSAERMAEDARRHGILTYDIGLPPGWPQNGLTREEMASIYEQLTAKPVSRLPEYFGGEIYAATGRDTARLAEEFDALWASMLRQFAEGAPRFNEEAHALSYLYYTLGYPSATANPYIKRMWTALLFRRNLEASDRHLAIWHLPAEKRFGFTRLYEQVIDSGSPFWSVPLGEPFMRYVGRYLGVPRRTPAKLFLDVRDALEHKRRNGGAVKSLAVALQKNTVHLLRGARDRVRGWARP